MDPPSTERDKYSLALLDDASGAVSMREKSRVPYSIKSITEAAENKTGKCAVTVRSDRAKEYMCKDIEGY